MTVTLDMQYADEMEKFASFNVMKILDTERCDYSAVAKLSYAWSLQRDNVDWCRSVHERVCLPDTNRGSNITCCSRVRDIVVRVRTDFVTVHHDLRYDCFVFYLSFIQKMEFSSLLNTVVPEIMEASVKELHLMSQKNCSVTSDWVDYRRLHPRL